MGSYFSSLIKHYGPADASAAIMPDVPEPTDTETTVAPAPMPQSPGPISDIRYDPPPEPTAAEDANLFQPAPAQDHFDPIDFEETHLTPDIDPLAPSEQIITEVTERVIHETVRPAFEDSGAPDASPPVETHLHETHQTDVHLTETHVHEAVPPSPEDPDHMTPEQSFPKETPAEPVPQDDPRDAMLGALEAHLEKAFASLTNPQEPPALTIVDAADFEPESTDMPPPLATEEVREVTREIVKEIHHHHHETKVVAEKAPAPRTAASASQIGPIRLSSHWGTS